ncbi:aldo/keto reductase [Ahrensia kielensis]|uniref:aldo/keto reductase n=1 Tax=Ahrensia kielensis TaxID=76980 RepID=UPI00039BCFFA|nr:aldo/keto reductase [Ahrensia kielensis]
MQMIDFKNAVPEMSRLIYGVWRLGDDADTSSEHIIRKVEACLDQGITTFDHADIYGGYVCEELFGNALKGRSDLKSKMQIITKCDIMLTGEAYPQRRVKYYDTSAAHINYSVENSLKRIGVDVIDMLLIHRPDPMMDHYETGAALDALVDSGKVRGIGVSNFMPWDIELLQSAMKHPILTNQIEVNILEHAPFTNGQIAKAQQADMPIMAWSSLAGGRLFDTSDEAAKRVMPRLKEIANEQNVGADAVAIAWLLAHPAQIMPVIGTNNIERIAKISDAMNVKIDRETWFELWTLAEGHEVP